MSAPRTLADVSDVPDEMTLRRLLAMLLTVESGGADAAA